MVKARKRGQPSNRSADKRDASPEPTVTPSSSRASSSSPSKSSPRNGSTLALTTFKQKVPISEFFIEYQQVKDLALSTADVNLICSDGIVPVHTVVLQSVSPFFEKMFTAQGDYYFGNRPVIIPDWSVTEIGRMIQFIYTGLANVPKSETENMKKMLEFFDVSVQADDIVTERKAAQKPILCFTGKDAEEIKLNNLSSGIKRKAEEDFPAGAKKIHVSKKGDGTLDKDVIVVIPRNKAISGPLSKKVATKALVDLEHISSTDTSDGEIDAPECKNSEWFVGEARRCQKCDQIYPNPAEASSCLTNNHNRLRCYLCFKVVRDTSKLFIHFSKKHKKGAREQSLVCSWCDQIVPYKSVSCHVISLHLTTMMNVGMNPAKNNRGLQGRRGPPTFPRAGPSSGLPSTASTNRVDENGKDKEDGDKDKEFKMMEKTKKGDDKGTENDGLNTQKQTIKIRSICGNTRVFVVNFEKINNSSIEA